ncbi:MAG: isochorismate synthase [Candidatus Marinimicrobia bacterium]|nr:isochorismate synthase [Candidatus Neomarinimicrobiota bacterium]MBL7023538.1 isochorismate synthase [Candidatus Neomarinimicrobiota bacterium]MBL7109562.1 isochorismate synthase [Candidatus Neomarinimicrobiota bacterium]
MKVSDTILFDSIQQAITKAKVLSQKIILSRSFKIESHDILPLLTHPSDKKKIRLYWEQPSKKFAIAGLGSAVEIDINSEISLLDANKTITEIFDNSVIIGEEGYAEPMFIGGQSFDVNCKSSGIWKNFPRGRFILPECIAVQNNSSTFLIVSQLIKETDDPNKIKNEFTKTCIHYQNRLPVTLPPIQRISVDKFKDIPDRVSYRNTILEILDNIQPGKVEKVVISRSHQVLIEKEFSCISPIQVLRNAYPNCTTFLFSFPNEGVFFGSTPERLIMKNGSNIQTDALAGTVARGANMEEDRLLTKTLLDSHKESEEHQFVIELIREKLETISSDLSIPDVPQIQKLKNVQHLLTPITGQLDNGKNVLDLVEYLHPTPAVAGTPTEKALEIIKKSEQYDRGWYSGPVGWIDKNGDGEFCVALRSAMVNHKEAQVFAGGGIVSESVPDKEWEETELKLLPIISALSGGQV